MTTAHLGSAYLTNAGTWRYWFGPVGDPLLVINDADADGSLWACDEPEGWAAPAAETPLDGRQWGDGVYAGATTYAERVLTWEGTTVCRDQRTMIAARQRLLAVASSRTEVLYTQDDYPRAKSLRLRATGQPKMRAFDGTGFDWSFVMVAEDPLKFDAAELATPHSVGLPVDPPGRVYNRTYNRLYGAAPADQRGTLQVVNSGDETSQALYVITGPAIAPMVTNTTTGERMGWTITLDEDDTLVANTEDETITLNGQEFYEGRAPGSVFLRTIPGPNDLRWDHDGDYNPDALLTVTTTSTWK